MNNISVNISLSKLEATTLPSEVSPSQSDPGIYWPAVFNVTNLGSGFELIPQFSKVNDANIREKIEYFGLTPGYELSQFKVQLYDL